MRKIKFRALVQYSSEQAAWETYEPLSMPAWLDFGKVIVKDLQFTGLTDKNGVEIYEGDIVKTPMGNICEIRWCKVTEFAPSPKPFKGKDCFEYTGFAAYNLKQQQAYHLDSGICEGEIIGNIHQNPDLLTP